MSDRTVKISISKLLTTYDELERVLAAQGRYQFIFKKMPQRDITD